MAISRVCCGRFSRQGCFSPSICEQDKSDSSLSVRNGFRSLRPCTTLASMDCFGLLSVLPQFLSSDESDKRPVWYSLREADHGSFWMESYHNSLGTGTGLEPVTSGLWGRRAAICSIPPYGRRRRLPVGARRRTHVVLMMGCVCLGLSRALHMALHSPFYMSYGVRHDAYGRRSCRLLHFIHLNTHTGLTAIAIHFASHPFLTITGHYPGGAILRRT